jgi:predicted PurR-regulated permease PerM
MTILDQPQQVRAFRWVVLALVIGAVLTFVPLWAPLVLAAWVATIARPLMLRIAKLTHGRHRAAGVFVVLLMLALFLPLAGSVLSLSRGAVELGRSVLKSDGAKSALVAIVSGGNGGDAEPTGFLAAPGKIVGLLQEHGAQAATILSGIAGAATEALLGLFIFIYGVYVFLVDGPAQYQWLEDHAPLEVRHTKRLAAAFNETGRGLFVSVGLTGLAQGIVATITYVALGVPRALVLGLLTCLASLIPSVGTALVWVPIALGLALAGKTVPAIVMAGVGVVVIGSIDNLMRPVFARYGKLELSTFVLVTAIFGGLAIFGTWGLLLGPLLVRLAKEGLVMLREQREETGGAPIAPAEGEGT